jgi:hypothetical protein
VLSLRVTVEPRLTREVATVVVEPDPSDVPTQVRIRTDGDEGAKRFRAIYRAQHASNAGSRTEAVLTAVRYYNRMAGVEDGVDGKIDRLLSRAQEQGFLTLAEIVEVLDDPALPIDHEVTAETTDPE